MFIECEFLKCLDISKMLRYKKNDGVAIKKFLPIKGILKMFDSDSFSISHAYLTN